MAHFAEIKDNIVQRVLRVSDDQEHRGQDFLSKDLNLGGVWVQCSYNGNFRKQYPGPGFLYNEEADVFITPQPYASWKLDEKYDWQPPTPKPEDGQDYLWNESTLSWEVTNVI